MADTIDFTGQVGDVYMTIWRDGSPWSDYFSPDELMAVSKRA